MGQPQTPKATPQRPATSRLLSMKFMNRLGPGDTTPTASSPLASSNPSTPIYQKTGSDGVQQLGEEGGDNRSAKRRKVSGAATAHSPASSPVVGGDASVAEIEAEMRASMDEDERRRQAAIKKRAAELGDEHWTWDAPLPPHLAAKLAANSATAKARLPYAIVRVGFAEIDERAETDHTATPTGSYAVQAASSKTNAKPNIMRFNMKKQASGAGDSNGDSDQEDDGDKKKSKKRSRSDMEAHGKKKDVTKLKHLTSLSSQGGQSPMKCHRCGRSGHKAVECPQSQQQRRPGSKKR